VADDIVTRIVRELPHCSCDPSVRMADAVADVAALLYAIDELHQPDAWPVPWCLSCFVEYPCPTARLLHPKEADRG